MAVVPLARDTEEERSRPRGARVVGEVGDLDRSALHDVRGSERCDDALQVHLRGESTNGALSPQSAPLREKLLICSVFVTKDTWPRHTPTVTLASGRRPGEPKLATVAWQRLSR